MNEVISLLLFDFYLNANFYLVLGGSDFTKATWQLCVSEQSLVDAYANCHCIEAMLKELKKIGRGKNVANFAAVVQGNRNKFVLNNVHKIEACIHEDRSSTSSRKIIL